MKPGRCLGCGYYEDEPEAQKFCEAGGDYQHHVFVDEDAGPMENSGSFPDEMIDEVIDF